MSEMSTTKHSEQHKHISQLWPDARYASETTWTLHYQAARYRRSRVDFLSRTLMTVYEYAEIFSRGVMGNSKQLLRLVDIQKKLSTCQRPEGIGRRRAKEVHATVSHGLILSPEG